MPAKSQAQRRYLAMKFGIEWMRAHGFDNKGKLPKHVKKTKKKPAKKRRPLPKRGTRTKTNRKYGK